MSSRSSTCGITASQLPQGSLTVSSRALRICERRFSLSWCGGRRRCAEVTIFLLLSPSCFRHESLCIAFSTLNLLTLIPLSVPRVLSSYDFSKAHPKLVKIEMIAEKVDQVAEAAATDIKNQYALKGVHDHSASDTDSDSSSLMSDGNFEDIVEDLRVYSEGLIDLTPSLETPANDSVVIEDTNLALVDDLSGIAEPARPFVLIIKDRFPSTPANLVKKLGEANWQRREILREKKASAPAMGPDSSNADEASSMSETVIDNVQHRASKYRSPRTSIVDSSVSFASIYQSNTTISNFSNSS